MVNAEAQTARMEPGFGSYTRADFDFPDSVCRGSLVIPREDHTENRMDCNHIGPRAWRLFRVPEA